MYLKSVIYFYFFLFSQLVLLTFDLRSSSNYLILSYCVYTLNWFGKAIYTIATRKFFIIHCNTARKILNGKKC